MSLVTKAHTAILNTFLAIKLRICIMCLVICREWSSGKTAILFFLMSCGYRFAPNETLFETIARKFANHGYKLPRLVFFNVNSRTGAVPVKQNELGVALVSGFSVNTINMIMSNKLDPFECLLDVLNTERYKCIEECIKDII